MEEFIKILLNQGGTVLLAVLFIYVFVEDRKSNKEEKANNTQVLKELSGSNQNIAESLNLLKVTIENNTAEYRHHDDKAEQNFSNINEHLVKIEEKLEEK